MARVAKKTSAKKAPSVAKEGPKPRRLKQSQYKSFRLHKKIRPAQPKLPSSWSLWKSTLKTLNTHRDVLFPIIAVYFVLTIILVRGITGGLDVGGIKDAFSELFAGRVGSLLAAGAIFGTLLGSAGTAATASGQFLQPALLMIVTLATVWSLRQLTAGEKVTFKEAFYKSPYPLVPFLLVMMVVGLQLIPFLVGNWLYAVVLANGIAVTAMEKFLWVLLFFLSALLSMYMITSSLFALFIVTLPDMTPLRALRSARQLVLHRRWVVLRKILFLPLGLLIAGAIIMLPILLFVTFIAEWVFLVLSSVAWIFSVTYVYCLYRELLHE